MDKQFNEAQAKKFLQERELKEKEEREIARQSALTITIDSLKKLFSHTDVEVYLVGSIIKPYMFRPDSDIDIVLKNFQGDRFDVWTKMESLVKKNIEVILFEHCPFQEHVIKNGYKVL